MRDLFADKKTRLTIIGAVGAILVFILLIIAGSSASKKNDKASEPVLENGPATIVSGDKLYVETGNYTRYLAIRNDLTAVSKKVYSDKSKTVLFTVDDLKKSSDIYTVKGYFNNNKKLSITMNIKNLPNDRMHIDATDKKGVTISDIFSSNSKRNQVISTLPKNTKDYDIDYVAGGEFFTITMHSLNDSILVTAKADLRTILEDPNFSDSSISVIYPSYLKGEPQYNTTPTERDPYD